MTDRLEITVLPPEPLMQIEIWGDLAAVQVRLGVDLPKVARSETLSGARFMWWEPRVWLVRGPHADPMGALADTAFSPTLRLPREAGEDQRGAGQPFRDSILADDGATIEVTGAFTRLRIAGAAWRELLMIGGVFDAESPAFAPGCIAGTVIHHLPVRLDVIDRWTVEAYTPPSYAAELAHHWNAAARRIAVAAPGAR